MTKTPTLNPPLIAPPPADCSDADLFAHFREVQRLRANMPYEDGIYACATCLRIGENVCGKANNPANRERFCSEACEALYERRDAIYRARLADITGPIQVEKPKLGRRRKS